MRLLLAITLLAAPAAAQGRRNLLETLTDSLNSDAGYEPAERAAVLSAIRSRFADYGLQVVDARRAKGVPVVLHVITEGAFDQAPPSRIADVAFAAWQAIARGADPEVVEGVALYGYRKDLPADTLAAWANGYRQMVENKVPDAVAADLVRLSMEKDLKDGDFNLLKWALVDGVKRGHDPKDYATFLFGRVVEGQGPGRVSGDAKAAFEKARRAKTKVALPPYEGVFAKAPPPPPVYVAPALPAPEPPPAAPATAAPSAPSKAAPAAPRSAPSPSPSPAPRPAEKPVPAPAPSKPLDPDPNQRQLTMNRLWPGLDASARAYLGTPYVWGGATKAGIDCSALTQNSYGENRVKIPRVSRDQWKTGWETQELVDGDLIFFNTMGAGVSHVGMVVDAKAGKFIHASSSKGVMIAELDKKYYKQRYLGARRVVR